MWLHVFGVAYFDLFSLCCRNFTNPVAHPLHVHVNPFQREQWGNEGLHALLARWLAFWGLPACLLACLFTRGVECPSHGLTNTTMG